MQLLETHTATKQLQPIRFQEYAVGIFLTIPTKSAIKKAIKKKLLFIDGVAATTAKYISGGEEITVYQSENSSTFKRLQLALDILFEDEYLAVIYKPAGILVSGNKFVTIANALSQNLKKSNQPDAVKPQPVHRLDYATSGLLVIGKTSKAIQLLGNLFEKREIQKTYIAVTIGAMNTSGTINLPLQEKNAITEYNVLFTVDSIRFKKLNLVKLQPKTGRKHQLRQHLSAIGNQILGDKTYGNPTLFLNGKGLYLHAAEVAFLHPFTNKQIHIVSNIPKKIEKIFPLFKNTNSH